MTRFTRPWTRREFVRTSTTAALLAAAPIDLWGQDPRDPDVRARAERRATFADAAAVRELALRAVDAAKAAGATYADVRVTRMVSESFIGAGLFLDREELAIGVRALVQGAWGFAASPYWDVDEATQLGRDAVAQAKINARVSPRTVDMGSYPTATGTWSTPIGIDPFAISLEEKCDFVVSFNGLAPRHIARRDVSAGLTSMGFVRQERAVANSDGAFFTQTLYKAGGEFTLVLRELEKGMPTGRVEQVLGRGIDFAGAGWELIRDAKLREQIPGLLEEAEIQMGLPHKPVEIGRYDVVCDARTMGNFLNATLATSTQIDRALGYEANAGGTSFLGPDPLARLGTTTLGSSLLNLHGNRSMARGLATVKWDDEGVEPDEFPIVTQGSLVDYQTTREQATWLASWYQQQQRPVRSHGCAGSNSALDITLQTAPNLAMDAGPGEVSFADLVAKTKKGLALVGGGAGMDFQARNGSGSGSIREITDGKLGAVVDGAGFLFDSLQLWKSLQAVGGPSSRETYPAGEVKGQPAQAASHSVSAVPGSFKDMIIVDTRRKG